MRKSESACTHFAALEVTLHIDAYVSLKIRHIGWFQAEGVALNKVRISHYKTVLYDIIHFNKNRNEYQEYSLGG